MVPLLAIESCTLSIHDGDDDDDDDDDGDGDGDGDGDDDDNDDEDNDDDNDNNDDHQSMIVKGRQVVTIIETRHLPCSCKCVSPTTSLQAALCCARAVFAESDYAVIRPASMPSGSWLPSQMKPGLKSHGQSFQSKLPQLLPQPTTMLH